MDLDYIASLVQHHVVNTPSVTWWKNINRDGAIAFAGSVLPQGHGLSVTNGQTEDCNNKHTELEPGGLYVIVANGRGITGANADVAVTLRVILDEHNEHIEDLQLVAMPTQEAADGLLLSDSDIFLAEADISVRGETFLKFLPAEAFQ